MNKLPGTGAFPSPFDIRTFKYPPAQSVFAKAPEAPRVAGKRWEAQYHFDQHSIGTCTATATAQLGSKLYGQEFSDDFQYLMQKKYYDVPLYPNLGWGEGSSAFHAIRVAREIGFLPKHHWTHTTEKDKKGTYAAYIKKLQAIPEEEIERLKGIAMLYKIKAFAGTSGVDRDTLARAIDESEAGLIVRFDLGREWYYGRNGKRTNDKEQLEPLRPPKKVISGHMVVMTNTVGDSFRISNTWGQDWCDEGTAYHLHREYRPTEAWIIWKGDVPKEIDEQLEARKKAIGQMMDQVQKLIAIVQKMLLLAKQK